MNQTFNDMIKDSNLTESEQLLHLDEVDETRLDGMFPGGWSIKGAFSDGSEVNIVVYVRDLGEETHINKSLVV